MDVYVTWCKRTAKCEYCGLQIIKATPMVVTSMWKKFGGGEVPEGVVADTKVRHWKIVKYWHFNQGGSEHNLTCWLQNAQDWLDRHPYQNSTLRGREPLPLCPEDRRKRENLIIRRAKYVARLREAVDLQQFETMEHLTQKIRELIPLIVPLGGIPTSWAKDMEASGYEVQTNTDTNSDASLSNPIQKEVEG